jgi:hypothetical protein
MGGKGRKENKGSEKKKEVGGQRGEMEEKSRKEVKCGDYGQGR